MPRDVFAPGYVRRLAQENRGKATLSERLLWSRLRRRALKGVWFKRQEPMGRYVADFCAPKEKLIVEIDGAAHAGQRAYDTLRDSWFASLGYRTIRVHAQEVEHNIEAVVAKIAAALQTQAIRAHSPGGVINSVDP